MAGSVTSSNNLDINSIVSQLMSVERQPISRLDVKEASYQAKLSAYGSVNGAVSSFQSAVQSLSSASNFQTLKATPSDATIFSASAASTAVAGTYSLEVTSLAQAQKLVAAGQTSSTTAIGDGTATTVTFDFGSIDISGGSFDSGTGKYTDAVFTSNGDGTTNITIDSSNNSLQGIRDAINTAQMGVTATIINDGSGTPYRLVLSSDSSGVSNSLKITTSGGDGTIATLLAHDPADNSGQNLSETVTAQNADFKVSGVAVSKTSNTVSDVIPGVTFTLNKETATPATLTVARDTATVSSSISAFVTAYNNLSGTLKNLSAYDAATQQGAILQGDSTVRSLQSQLRSMLSTPVTGTSGALTTLSDVGVSFQKDGTLKLDQTRLDSAMASNFSDIASLFASVGNATDSLVSYSSATSSTKAGSYAVNVTQLATQGKAVGDADVSALSTIDATNDTLELSVDGEAVSITLAHGAAYTAQTLAAELQSKINSVSELSAAGISVAVTESGGFLTITSVSYGSSSVVDITGGNGAAALMGAPTETNGLNAAGSIGGVLATGSGQILSAASGDPQGLSIAIIGGALGARGTLDYAIGYASSLKEWATSILASDGILASRTDGIDKTIADIDKRRAELETRLIGIEKRYRAQFTALDVALSSMNATSTYLTQQLDMLANLK